MNGALFMLVLLLISVSGQVLMLGQAQEWAYEAGRAITAGLQACIITKDLIDNTIRPPQVFSFAM